MAKAVKTVLDGSGVESFVKTSGKTGLHVFTPWEQPGGFDEAREWALGVANRVTETMPDRATVAIRKVERGDRVYIDVLQNARGHHAVPPYVLRAVADATISTPLEWRELTDKLVPDKFTLKKVVARFARQKADPFAHFIESLAKALEKKVARW